MSSTSFNTLIRKIFVFYATFEQIQNILQHFVNNGINILAIKTYKVDNKCYYLVNIILGKDVNVISDKLWRKYFSKLLCKCDIKYCIKPVVQVLKNQERVPGIINDIFKLINDSVTVYSSFDSEFGYMIESSNPVQLQILLKNDPIPLPIVI